MAQHYEVPTIADIQAFFSNPEIIEPEFDDAELELAALASCCCHHQDDREAA